jgi:hypothetical protein
MILIIFPLIALVVIAYNVMALAFGTDFNAPHGTWTLPSGQALSISYGAILIIIGLVMSAIEVMKSTRSGAMGVIDHALSMALFVICLIEFLLLPAMGTQTFLILTIMTLVDIVAGFAVSMASARRDISFDGAMPR